jgi:hypothetical protein
MEKKNVAIVNVSLGGSKVDEHNTTKLQIYETIN